ncbi:MAG TPA: AAA family ATPase [Rudaea sp.]|nr:AAA family ATPase [Rudaea sp.]HSC12360.1 AAA family ATPase [Rhodanobacteraceae bacterium]
MSESVSSGAPAPAAPTVGATPVVVALIGLPGAGKSVVARALSDQLGLRRVCRDTIRHAMFPACAYSFAEKRAAFRATLLALEINCLLGQSTVIDGVTFSRRADLGRVDSTIRRYGFTPIPIFLDCPPRVAYERIAREVELNKHLARDRSPGLVYEVQARFDTPPPNALVVNANQPAADVCRIVVEAVAAIRDRAMPSIAAGEG